MLDVFMVALRVGIFAAAIGCTYACESSCWSSASASSRRIGYTYACERL